MRALRRPRDSEEEESAYVSMTDLTVGFLFIVMLMMAYFATQFGRPDSVPRQEHERVVAERDALREELSAAQDRIAALERALASAEAARQALAEALAEVQAERDALREELIAAQDRIAALERALASAEAARQALAEALAASQAELRARDAALTAVQDELARERSARFEVEARLAELAHLAQQDTARELARALGSARAELVALREALARAQERIAELERRLAERDPRNPLEAYLTEAHAERRRLLEAIRSDLVRLHPQLLVEVSPEGDALRFQGEGLFASGSAALRPQARAVVQDLARLLDEAIACLTLAAATVPRPEGCNATVIVEALQIEGHTDTVGGTASNLTLSTARANAAFLAMLEAAPTLERRFNLRGQPVPGVVGYGEMRLARPTADDVNEPGNRRIDIRILMQTPATEAEIATIRRRLTEGR